MMQHPSIHIITGEQGSGKTNFVKALIALIREQGIHTDGFYAEGYWKDGLRSGFDIVEANGARRECLCNTSPSENDEAYKRFYFKQAGLHLGHEILLHAFGKKSIVFIDEIGGMELEGKGWAVSIDLLLKQPPTLMIWSVRKSQVAAVTQKWQINPAIWDIMEHSPLEVSQKIRNDFFDEKR